MLSRVMTLETVNLAEYVTCPLSEDEVGVLEAEMGRLIPAGFRSFLLQVGIPQSLVSEIIHDEGALVRKQRSWKSDGFVFAEPGEGVLVETARGEVIEASYGESRVAFRSFDAFLADSIAQPHDPNELCWAVQLSFATRDEQRVRETLQHHLGVQFDVPWERLKVSRAGVTSYRAACLSVDHRDLKRLEYPGWDSPIFFLDQRVPSARIRTLKSSLTAWRFSDLGFKLVNYGILPKDLEE
jgi:hypothetical protein